MGTVNEREIQQRSKLEKYARGDQVEPSIHQHGTLMGSPRKWIELEVSEVSWEILIFRGLEKEKDPEKETKIREKPEMNDVPEV